MKVICINGAPGVGKDTAGEILARTQGFKTTIIHKFAAPLDNIVQSMLGLSRVQYLDIRESLKDEPLHQFKTESTLRELLIAVSEDLIKPHFGKTYFGVRCAERLWSLAVPRGGEPLVIITDSGFQYEYEAFKESVSNFAEVKLIHMTRTGHTFENDSREVVDDPGNTIYLNNDGTLEELEELLKLEIFEDAA